MKERIHKRNVQGEPKGRKIRRRFLGAASRASSIDNSWGFDGNQILGPIPSSVPIQDFSLHRVFGRHSIRPDISREWISQFFLAESQVRSRNSILSLHQLLIFIGHLELSKTIEEKGPFSVSSELYVSKVILPSFVLNQITTLHNVIIFVELLALCKRVTHNENTI